MKTYRIVQDRARAEDLSGAGAFRRGGRWNSKGTYMLYTSENISLAYLESLVHFDKMTIPPKLFITELEIANDSLIYTLPDAEYPARWMKLSTIKNQKLGDQWAKDKLHLGIKLRSAINEYECNILLNPGFPRFHDLVKIISIREMTVDDRLV